VIAIEAGALLARGAANSVKLVEHCLAPIAVRDGAVHADVCHDQKTCMFTKPSRSLDDRFAADNCTIENDGKVDTLSSVLTAATRAKAPHRRKARGERGDATFMVGNPFYRGPDLHGHIFSFQRVLVAQPVGCGCRVRTASSRRNIRALADDQRSGPAGW